MTWTVYKHIAPNGKVYIGMTCQKPEHRWGRDGSGYRYQPFDFAIRKYGWENIEHVILLETKSKEEACKAEIQFIADHNATDRNFGYNFCTGGEVNDARRGSSPSEETRKKIGDAHRGAKNYNYGKPLPEWHKQRLREFRTGRKLSEETKRKISERGKGANNWNAKPVLQFTKEGVFVREWICMSDAAESLCGRRAGSVNISSCCSGKLKSAYGFIWKHKTRLEVL